VLVDDDTIVNVDNLVDVLSKYDWTEMVYIGGPSESHSANTCFSHTMAFGGGGIAISYPLAQAIEGIQDECLERYPKFYGSDDRLHACISELGVPLTREYGFHQVCNECRNHMLRIWVSVLHCLLRMGCTLLLLLYCQTGLQYQRNSLFLMENCS
jgi:Protein of unknown function, DUF604